jgi:ribosome recycling factor
MDQKQILEELDRGLRKAELHAAGEFATVHAGKASPLMLDSVQVDVYGTMSRIRDIAAITTPDARTVAIQPWDRGTFRAIEKAILLANIGFTPVVDADRIRCIVPEMSRERRQELVKLVSTMAEAARVSVREARRKALESLRSSWKTGVLSEDDEKRCEKEAQKRTDGAIATIGSAFEKKEKELMTV